MAKKINLRSQKPNTMKGAVKKGQKSTKSTPAKNQSIKKPKK